MMKEGKKMSSERRTNPAGAPIEPCERDKACKMVTCASCMAEVPASVAKTYEGPDYVHHFCGLECFERWRAQVNKTV
jgi:hypothetical protein